MQTEVVDKSTLKVSQNCSSLKRTFDGILMQQEMQHLETGGHRV